MIRTGELIERQRRLARRVIVAENPELPPATVVGVDAAFPRGREVVRGAAVLMRFPELEVIAEATVERPLELPYIPGLLSFRELPAIMGALQRLESAPDLVLCDGQGIAHPRRFGIACHLGVETGLATIGVAKSRLCGTHEAPGPERGERRALSDRGETIGMVVRSRSRVRPLFISPGHRIDLAGAVAMTLACTGRFRLPEPVRRADRLAGAR